MLEFISAVVSDEDAAAREAKVKALMAGEEVDGKTQDPMNRENAEAEADEDPYTDFMLDERKMRAYQPTSGQLAFMLASLGRGQTQDQRFAAILNIMFECLREDDKDHLESRLLTRDRKKRLDLAMLEEIFEGLTKEWFARPTK